MIADAHVHFFSSGFYRALAASRPGAGQRDGDGAQTIPDELGWTPPGSNEELADAWVAELDRHGVSRATLIASVHGDDPSVAAAVGRHPSRFAGAFMLNPAAPDALARVDAAFAHPGMRMVCLFPAMHHVAVDDERSRVTFEAAERHGRVVFVHCGVLSVGVRKKLGLPSVFDIRLGDPLAVAAVALRHPTVPVIIPHFGGGNFSAALMAAAMAPNILFDTSSSNGWMAFHPGLTLRDVFARALDVVGPSRLLFGSDSSFFPRGWQQAVHERQHAVVADLGLGEQDRAAIFWGNFSRVVG
jgi:predicted TIM-barrel fold metal-dependent hydrolase